MDILKTYLKKNDVVMVVAGKEKGKSGRLLRLLPKNSRAIVEKVNMVKKHQKPTANNHQGGIVEKEASIHISNIMLYCSKCSKPVRIANKQGAKGKVRVCKKCGSEIGKAA